MIIIEPGRIQGTLSAPASKSHVQRLLLAASLAKGETRILHPGHSEDVLACARVIEGLGAQVVRRDDQWLIQGGLAPIQSQLDCGESGFCLRAATALAALHAKPITLLGKGTLAMRPMKMIENPLRALGVRVSSQQDCVPICVQGPYQSGMTLLDGRESSQFLSGLLMALPKAHGIFDLVVIEPKSLPYVQMTLDVLKAFQVSVKASPDLTRFRIEGDQSYQSLTRRAEGDWSGAAFWLVAGALWGDICVEGLDPKSLQADRAIVDALEYVGAQLTWEGSNIWVQTGPMRPLDFDATHCPDLFPPLAALACHLPGRSRIKGVGRLRHKESDRAKTLVQEMGAMGAHMEVSGDELFIEGGSLRGGHVNAHQDHRIAMACAIAALKAQGPTHIEGESCVAKSYPDFFKDLEKLRKVLA